MTPIYSRASGTLPENKGPPRVAVYGTISSTTESRSVPIQLITLDPFDIDLETGVAFTVVVLAVSQDGKQQARFARQSMLIVQKEILSFYDDVIPICTDINEPGWELIIYANHSGLNLNITVAGDPQPLWVAQFNLFTLQ